MTPPEQPVAGPSTSGTQACQVCGDPNALNTRNGVTSCRPCREFFRRHSSNPDQTTTCPQGGNCLQTRGNRKSCVPCRMRRCLEAGLSIRSAPRSQSSQADVHFCHTCKQVNPGKSTISCSQCDRTHHRTCVGITQAQAAQLPTWHCDACLRSDLLRDAAHDAPQDNHTPPEDMAAALADLKARTRVLQHVPRKHRHRIAADLAGAITDALEQRSPLAWWRLLSFTYSSLLAKTADTPSHPAESRTPPQAGSATSEDNLSRRVMKKCADGDIRAALRLLTTSDSIAPPSDEVTEALRAKHPPAIHEASYPELPDPEQHRLTVEIDDVRAAIKATPPGSAAGLDGLRPLHLSQLVAGYTAEAGRRLLSALTELCNSTIAGNIPDFAREAFFGASLTAIRKKDGGVRPIAVGSIFRRLASKILAKYMSAALATELQPVQLGVGVRMGCEAAVHAVRYFTDTHVGTPGMTIIKLDLTNAFNTIHRPAVLREVIRRFPAAAPLVSQAYCQPSPLHFGPNRIWSCRGVQQGDPLGPILFSLALDPVIQSLNSPLNLWYLDDGTIGGPADSVASDLNNLFPSLRDLGLEVNLGKCEVTRLYDIDGNGTTSRDRTPPAEHDPASDAANTSTEGNTASHYDTFLNLAHVTPLTHLTILGAPIHPQGYQAAIANIDAITGRMIDRTANISSHAALFFLSRYAAVPRATYLLRAAPIHTAEAPLRAIDERMREATSRSCNVHLCNDSWTQASLPLRLGGLGVRRLTDVALPAYIASVEESRELVCTINRQPNDDRPLRLTSAMESFTSNQCPDFNQDLPLTQRTLDEEASKHRLNTLLAQANQVNRARLLAATAPHSGAWLSAVPVECLGLLLPDDAVRVGVALRLGTTIQQPHRCRCGTTTDAYGYHSLSCSRNPGRQPRHAALNDLIYRALSAAGLSAILEPRGLDRGDGRRPDGVTVFPFRRGRMLMWDATCVNTFASTHLLDCASTAGAAARAAEVRKRQRYAALAQRYDFAPLAVETSGVMGPAFNDLLQDIGKRVSRRTGEPRETAWLRQRVSLAVVRGNTAAICGA